MTEEERKRVIEKINEKRKIMEDLRTKTERLKTLENNPAVLEYLALQKELAGKKILADESMLNSFLESYYSFDPSSTADIYYNMGRTVLTCPIWGFYSIFISLDHKGKISIPESEEAEFLRTHKVISYGEDPRFYDIIRCEYFKLLQEMSSIEAYYVLKNKYTNNIHRG